MIIFFCKNDHIFFIKKICGHFLFGQKFETVLIKNLEAKLVEMENSTKLFCRCLTCTSHKISTFGIQFFKEKNFWHAQILLIISVFICTNSCYIVQCHFFFFPFFLLKKIDRILSFIIFCDFNLLILICALDVITFILLLFLSFYDVCFLGSYASPTRGASPKGALFLQKNGSFSEKWVSARTIISLIF